MEAREGQRYGNARVNAGLETTGYVATETLYQDDRTIVCRAVRDADGRTVLLKALHPRGGHPRAVERLRNEYEIGRTLDIRAIVRPLALETYRGMPTLVLEDFGGHPLTLLVGKPMAVGPFLDIAVRIAAAVEDVHREGIVHKDLKPDNILVDAVSREVKIADFGLATRLPREQPAATPQLIEGSLPYMSPEQTGRMNRAIDSRSDLYSLGVTFHELLTGRLPFEGGDPLEWIHCHVARAPAPVSQLVPEVPETIARIVLKLLAKMADDRYQTAAGLEHDLERCLEQWRCSGTIEPFPLGERDASDRFQIPQKLYGRDDEIATLLGAFERVVETGSPELVLVSGYSGIGKSSLVHELHEPIVREGGFFVAGKFDRYGRDVPYSTILQAFRELVLEILADGEERVAAWKRRLQSALGINAQLVVDVIPPLERLIGPQPPVAELPPIEAQNRFRIAFRRFIGAFAREGHPLTLFVDDLQWADLASLALLQELATHPEVRHLLVVGAYRDNEVTPAHPLSAMLEDARTEGARMSKIVLRPLSPGHLARLVGDAFHRPAGDAASLADLVHQKTSGNPFFAIQFLTALHEEHLVEFDLDGRGWRWDVAKIRAKGFTENVVDLLIGKVNRLSAAARGALEQLACLGNSADAATLAMVLGRSDEEVHAELWEALREGLLARLGDTYEFVHDRVQETAYSLLPDESRPAVHLRLGRLLRSHLPLEAIQGRIFEVVNQLNRGAGLIDDTDERVQVAQLDLEAGRKAKASAAYRSAGAHFAAGMALLPEDGWSTHHELTWALHVGRAECAYLEGEYHEAERLSEVALERARTHAERATVCRLRIDLYTTQGEFARALASGIDCLRLLGIHLPASPTAEQVRAEEQLVWTLLGERQIEELIDLPAMTNPAMSTALEILSAMHPPSHFADENLFLMIPARMTSISLRHGNAPASAMAYATFGVVVSHRFGKYREGHRFGQLAVNLVDRTQAVAYRSKVYFLMGGCIAPYSRPLTSSLEYLDRCFQAALETGDVTFACYSSLLKATWVFIQGAPLNQVHQQTERCLELARRAKFELIADAIVSLQRLVQALRGHTAHLGSFDDAQFSERSFEARVRERFIHNFCWYQVRKLQLRYIAGDCVGALEAADELRERSWVTFAEPVVPQYAFYSALTLAALHPQAPAERQQEFARALESKLRELERWAESCPETFLNRSALVSAEVARIEGRDLDAMRLYEQAIRSARENGFVQNEALAHELASKFHRARCFDLIADAYLREARACYGRWGADGKVRQIDQLHPRLLKTRPPVSTATLALRAEQLDLLSVVKASQAISGEIVFENLVGALLQVTLEQGGAQRGYLILARDGDLSVEAEAILDEEGVTTRILPSLPVESSPLVPVSIVHHAQLSREPVILDDTEVSGGKFASDAYLARHRPRSVLCLPILRQARLMGLLYLENDLVSGAFTPDRLAALAILASQAAISMENAFLLAKERVARSAAEEAERRSTFLAEAGKLLSESLDYGETLARLGRLCVRSLADWCVIDVVEDHTIHRAAGAHADPAKETTLKQLLRRYPPSWGSPHPAAECLRTGEPILMPDIPDDRLRTLCEDDEHMKLIRELGTRSSLAVPLLAGGAPVGALTMGSGAPGRYGPAELELVQEVAHRAAIAIDNARLYREVQRAVRVRDEFLAVASHELRTPMTALLLSLQTLLRAARPGRPIDVLAVSRSATLAARQGDRLNHLVDGLLDVSRIETGRLPLALAEVDLGEVVRDVVERFEPALTRAGCPVSIRGDASVMGRWDRSRLDQVVTNLLANAVKFGLGKPIEIVLEEHAGVARLVVRDHGIGIDEDEQPRIFERFARAVSSSNYGGLGLGLYISRCIVEAHGGRIGVVSQRASGSTFTIELPCAPSEDARVGAVGREGDAARE